MAADFELDGAPGSTSKRATQCIAATVGYRGNGGVIDRRVLASSSSAALLLRKRMMATKKTRRFFKNRTTRFIIAVFIVNGPHTVRDDINSVYGSDLRYHRPRLSPWVVASYSRLTVKSTRAMRRVINDRIGSLHQIIVLHYQICVARSEPHQ